MHVAGSVAAHHRLTPADRGYCCLPLFHINAEVVGLLATLAAGACLVVDRELHPARVLGADRDTADHLDQRGSGDHHHPGHGSARGTAQGVSASSVRPPRRWPPRRCGGSRRRSACGGGDLRDDRGGQHDHRQPPGRAAQGRGPAQAGRYRGPGGQPGRGSAPAVPGRHDRPGADQGPGRHHGVRGGRPGRRHRRGRLARDRRPRPPGPGRLPVPGRPVR